MEKYSARARAYADQIKNIVVNTDGETINQTQHPTYTGGTYVYVVATEFSRRTNIKIVTVSIMTLLW